MSSQLLQTNLEPGNITIDTRFQSAYESLTLQFKRLGYDMSHLKFTPGLNTFGNFLVTLSSTPNKISPQGIQLLNTFATQLGKEDIRIKQANLGKKLSEFVEKYNLEATSSKQLVSKTSSDIAAGLEKIRNLGRQARASREWNYVFGQDMLDYMLTVGVSPKETLIKVTDRKKLLAKFTSQNILAKEDINFLDNYSNFNAFCALFVR